MLSVMVAWGKRWSHNNKGKIGSTVHRAAMKWFLKVLTALSAAFLQCMCGGTSWNCISESSKYFLRSSDISISMMWSLGVNPRCLNLSLIFVITLMMQGPVLLLSGVVRILLAS